eukprot:6195882-Pleurochrysis_carterae.AAC.1
MAYLAVDACHGLFQAIDACHGSPHSKINLINFRFHHTFSFIVWVGDHVDSAHTQMLTCTGLYALANTHSLERSITLTRTHLQALPYTYSFTRTRSRALVHRLALARAC